jgi:preprotein translocase subunit SecF
MFDFYSKRKIFIAIPIVIILIGIVFFFINDGFVLDIQFQGGTQMQIEMNDSDFDVNNPNEDLVKAEEVIKSIVDKRVTVRHTHSMAGATEGSKRMDFLVIGVATGEEMLSDSEQGQIISALREEFKIKDDAQIDSEAVNASISKDLRSKGLLAVLLTSIAMLIYVWIRFNIMSGLLAGLTAILALAHDITIMMAVYVIFGIPLNETFIAAVLTILGYSINDTIVIYDRIRENSKQSRKDSIEGLVNKSINQSLKRTINTSITTLMAVIIVYIFASISGITSLKEFALPIIVGLIAGTYSSIFIATPLWAGWKSSQQKKQISQKPSKA